MGTLTVHSQQKVRETLLGPGIFLRQTNTSLRKKGVLIASTETDLDNRGALLPPFFSSRLFIHLWPGKCLNPVYTGKKALGNSKRKTNIGWALLFAEYL
jgi:hypothetical protein